MSGETLSKAAKIMRERAEAATPGPWWAVAGTWEDEEFAAVVRPGGDPGNPQTWLMATGRGGASQKADARYVAPMHPGVALDVAAWLDETAEFVASILDLERGHINGEPCSDYACRLKEAALKVARAYLGGDE